MKRIVIGLLFRSPRRSRPDNTGWNRPKTSRSPRQVPARPITTTCSRCFSTASPKNQKQGTFRCRFSPKNTLFRWRRTKGIPHRLDSHGRLSACNAAEERKDPRQQKHISESLAASLRELFRLLIRQIEKPTPDEARRGSDGTTYFFASTDNEGETTVGETWSPEPASALGRLVGICNDPHAIGNRSTGGRHDRTEEELLGQIRALTNDLSGNE